MFLVDIDQHKPFYLLYLFISTKRLFFVAFWDGKALVERNGTSLHATEKTGFKVQVFRYAGIARSWLKNVQTHIKWTLHNDMEATRQ